VIRVVALGLVLVAGDAFAHAALVASEPADGAVLERAPTSSCGSASR
jgi:methionine-rich copper-binding protein CopC